MHSNGTVNSLHSIYVLFTFNEQQAICIFFLKTDFACIPMDVQQSTLYLCYCTMAVETALNPRSLTTNWLFA